MIVNTNYMVLGQTNNVDNSIVKNKQVLPMLCNAYLVTIKN